MQSVTMFELIAVVSSPNKMEYRIPIVRHSRGNGNFENRGFVKYKPRLNWKKNDGRRKEGFLLAHERNYEAPRFQKFHAPARFEGSLFQNVSKVFMRNEQRVRPEAPRNSTSYIIRSKCMDGTAPVVTPSPITPAVIVTPGLSPLPRYSQQFADEVTEWGVNGYGSMNGLIRAKTVVKDDSESDSRSSHAQSVEQLEERLDQDLNRFEMVYPSGDIQASPVESLLFDHEYHIAQLKSENNTLKERIKSIEDEVDGLKTRVQMLEGGSDAFERGKTYSETSIGNEL